MLRAPEPCDLDALYLWENDPAVWRVSFNDGPVSRHALWQYIENYSSDISVYGQLRLMIVCDSTGESVGTIDLSGYSARHRRAELGVYVAPRFRRCGYALGAVHEMCDYARDVLGLHQLVAMMAVDNKASIGLFTVAGFRTCGCLRSYLRLNADRYTDVLLAQKFLV